MRLPALAVLSLLVAPPVPRAAAQSIHQLELEEHRGEPLAPRIVPDEARLRAGATKSVTRIVYGYYPYWVHDLTAIRWEALTHLAWFAVEIDSSGLVTDDHGWPDQETVDAAHTAGVRVDLTFTLFSGTGIRTLCTDPARRATAIATMVDQMEVGGADGISVDFEGLIDGTRDAFTTFIAELRAELDARGHTDAGISIAGPEVNWAGSDGIPEFDLNALLDSADIYFAMGYGYFWGGSSHAGPIGITWLSPDWRPVQSWSMLRSIAQFTRDIPPEKRRQLVHGVPYYGREWVTTTDEKGASVVDHIGAVTYTGARADLAAGQTRLWDEGIANPWYVWQSAGAWHQVWYDDEESLSVKYQLALDQDLGGIGMWALNYDNGHQELWDLLETAFGAEPQPQPGHRLRPLPIDALPFHDERDTRDAPGTYFNYYSCAADVPEYGREWVYSLDVCQPGLLTATVPEDPWVDVDLHLLTEPAEAACLARANLELTTPITPGSYLLVVDTWVRDHVTTEGPFTLDVTFEPSSGPPLTACADGCADLATDPLHCGACGTPCATGATCEQGTCLAAPEPPSSAGCGCRTAGREPSTGGALLVVLLLGLSRRRITAGAGAAPRR